MARTWRKGFVLFVIILTLTTLWRVIIPSHDYDTTTLDLNGSRIPPRDEVWNANRQNVTLSQLPFRPSIEGQNHRGNWPRINQTETYRKTIRRPTPLQPHSRISIYSDADFANQGWPGNGTQENPYVIRDLHITGGDLDCIQIRNTRVHFIVANCLLEYGRPSLLIENVTNALIANTTCDTPDDGVQLIFSESIELFNNTCINTDQGISVRESIAVKIVNNNCTNSDFGLMVFDSYSTEIINNTIKDCYSFGCEIYPVNDNILANNSLLNCGFFFGSWDELWGAPTMGGVGSFVDLEAQISGNFVNQRPLILWLWRVEETVPSGGGQIILLNCSRVTVQNQVLTNASIGIFLCFTTHSNILNNTFTNHSVNGIRIQNCVNITVNNNLCTNNSRSGITLDQTVDTILTENSCNYHTWRYGIRLFESYDNELCNNTCNYNWYGIYLDPSYGNQLLNNTCNHNTMGIRLYYSEDNQLLNNTCNHNQGIWWWWGWGEWGSGIMIIGEDNIAKWNRCYNNSEVGIGVLGQDNRALENTCTNNRYGIFLDSDTTPISKNLCVNNSIGIYINNYVNVAIIDNTMVGCGLYINYHGSEWIANVDIRGNTVNGRPIIFFMNRANRQTPSRAGQIILFNCQGITVRGQTLTDCSYGLLVYCTNHSLFVDIVAGDNTNHGILLFDSHNNHFTRNILINNNARGIYLIWSCQDNIVDWNIFLCNASHDAQDNGPEFQSPGANSFDCNYWANYTGYDVDLNGFGDIPYNITGSAGNRDLHPLISPFAILASRSAERILFLLQSVAIVVIVIMIIVLVRAKFRRRPLTSRNNLRSDFT
jgi:parallel beta-helix repeat protein